MSERPRFRMGKNEFDDVQFFVGGKEFWLRRVWADSKRLDWLLKQDCRVWYGSHFDDFSTVEDRAAVDSAMKEEKDHE